MHNPCTFHAQPELVARWNWKWKHLQVIHMVLLSEKIAMSAQVIKISMPNTYVLNYKFYDTGTSNAQPDWVVLWISQ